MRSYGWTYDYLLWGISWVNVRLMLDDSSRIITKSEGADDFDPNAPNVVHKTLETKEDISNYLKNML